MLLMGGTGYCSAYVFMAGWAYSARMSVQGGCGEARLHGDGAEGIGGRSGPYD